MSLRGRVDRLEIRAEEALLLRIVEELAAEAGIHPHFILDDTRRLLARLKELERTHPPAADKGKVDIEQHLRMLAEEERLDPDALVADVLQTAEREEAAQGG